MAHPDLVIQGANLITLDAKQPRATALAVLDDRIVAVGSDEEIGNWIGPVTRRLGLGGKTVTPGFIDAHVHLMDYGDQLLRQADLVGSASIDDMLGRLSDLARRRTNGWIVAYGFDQDKMQERRFPTRQDLDRVSADRPIIVWRICGHAVVVNSAAIALLNAEERAAGDEQSGLYLENAAWAISQKIPPLSDDEMEEAVLRAAKVALRSGITSVHAMMENVSHMLAYMRLRRRNSLPLRVTAIAPYAAMDGLYGQGIGSNVGDEWLKFGALKLFADGSLGAQTALLSQPYADKPATCGIRFHTLEELKGKCAAAHAKGFQLAIHAIGDRAVRETIEAIEFALAEENNAAYRHRIEHVSMIDAECIERMARRGIVGTLQPQFVTSDTWTPARIGEERIGLAYPFASMLRAGVNVALGSDCPVERLNAFACLAAAVGRAEWSPNEKLTAAEAIRAYCMGGAYAGFAERQVGSLQVGKLADFVVLAGDPTRMSAEQIGCLRAEAVFVGGIQVDFDQDQSG